ncbi:phosphotransferase family protein [Pseudonocardia sp. HH130630-07]|uniref:phosphotransferase family protein n=1 Tax=Pseudonocardia sp. HH130630-07 TaxID=1690815 RepID=UPI000814E06D|nr:phosphotransferase family protein [Pseudonocardia sp. HH130630-07]ANY08728.1 aminoglycoside phosphotransferase [Pseudonocardia sp. HH130630-07]
MTTSARTPTPGADPEAVGRWLATVLDDERWTGAELAPIGAGRSNLTYRVSSPAGAVVLRRPPVGTVAATAHDMGREQRVIAALGPTAVPVPAVLATFDGEGAGPTDAPCFVMELVDGVVPLSDWSATPEQRRAAGDALVEVLATLHAVEPGAVGLGDFGRPEGFMERQIRRWSRQWADARDGAANASDERTGAEVTRLAERLAEDVPVAQRHTVVHGDYRLDNCVLDAQDPGRIRAVLDWEMSTLGDPLADLGLLLVYWRQAGDDEVWSAAQPLPSATGEPGFPTRRELVDAYAARSGLDVTPLPWYVAFGAFKLAVVIDGILARVRAGSVPESMADGLHEAVAPVVALGHHVLDGGSL